jgi:hypothetical protein
MSQLKITDDSVTIAEFIGRDERVKFPEPGAKSNAPQPEEPTKTSDNKGTRPKLKNGRKWSCTGRCQELILEGLSDSKIWEIIKVEGNLDNKCKTYPAWNRSMMKRTGMIK